MAEHASDACPACDHDLRGGRRMRGVDRLEGTPGTFEVVTCRTCGTGATRPRVSDAELARFYPDSYGPYDDMSRAGVLRVVSTAIRWWQVRRLLAARPLRALAGRPPGRLVDVGCGRGDLAGDFVRRGWQATGVEPSPRACAAAAARGVDARVGTLADVSLEPRTYDAAVFHHSLEHTGDPVKDLERARAALRPDGLALVTVPNYGCWQRRLFGSRWYHLDLPRHRTHFSPPGLRTALERAGFTVTSMGTSTSTVGLPASIQYSIAGRCLFPRGLALRVASGLCAAVLPIARALDRLGGGGDQLHAVARPRQAPQQQSRLSDS